MHESGTSSYLLLAMAFVVVVVVGAFAAFGRAWGRRSDRSGAGKAVGVAVGSVFAVVVVTYVFFESSVAHASLTLEIPVGYDGTWVAILEDPTADTTLRLSRPFHIATVQVPASGVVRVRSLDPILERPLEARIAHRGLVRGMRIGEAPTELRARRMVLLAWGPDGSESALELDDDALRSLLRERESAR